jgi:ribosome-binding protein aMBF1 (putative translation factor)
MKHPTEKRGRIHGDCHLCGRPTRWGVLRADGLVCGGCERLQSAKAARNAIAGAETAAPGVKKRKRSPTSKRRRKG